MADLYEILIRLFDLEFINLLMVNFLSLSIFFLFLPGLSGNGISGLILRTPIILAITLCVTSIEMSRGVRVDSPGHFILLVSIKAFALSLIPVILASGMRLAGYLIGISSGLNFAGIIDPALGQTQSELPKIFGDIKIFIFLASGGHYILLESLLNSSSLFSSLDISSMAELVKDLFLKTFTLGFIFALPMLGGIFLVNLAMGVISKAVPTFNVFVMGYPLTLLLGLYFGLFFMNNFVLYYDLLLREIF